MPNASDNISLKQIRVFLAAAEYENFSLAAERLYITQPLVSHTIAQLEQALGHPLFTRDKKRVRLNQSGRILQSKLKSICTLIDQAVESSRQAWENTESRFVVSLPMSADNQKYFFPVLNVFNQEFPNIHLKTDQMEIGNAISSVIAGTVDLAFTVYPEIMHFQNLPIAYEKICTFPTYAEVPVNNHLYSRSSIMLSDLVDEPLALLSDDGTSGYTDALLGLFSERHLTPTATYFVSSTSALEITSFVGEGITFKTAISAQQSDNPSRRIPILDAPNGIIAFWHRGFSNSLIRRCIALSKTHLSQYFSQFSPVTLK